MKKEDKIFLVIIISLTLILPTYLIVDNITRTNDVLLARSPENGNWSKHELSMNQDQIFELRIQSEDVLHSFTIKEIDFSVELYPGRSVTITLENLDPGVYEYSCQVYCSPRHLEMTGILYVN